jgi:uncharacterized protein YsxB (DUF464 family)
MTSSFSQKALKVDNIISIPIGNELGLVREYSKDDLLTFIEMSGWVSSTKENIDLVPKAIARLSIQTIKQIQIEAKNTWYISMSNQGIHELRAGIISKYGIISADNFIKFGILLITLEKIDRLLKYNL